MNGPRPDSPAPSSRFWKTTAFVLAALAASRFVFILLRHDAYGIAKYFMADDAFYYFQIARKVADGFGSTFDGVHVTNGYHPLWLLLSSAVFRIVPGDSAALMTLYAMQVAMLFASAAFLYLALRPIDDVAAALTVALLLASNVTRGILFLGMESAPAFLFACVLLWLSLRPGSFLPRTFGSAVLLFLLLLAISLSRLEAGLLSAGWLVCAWILDTRRGGHARAGLLGVAVGLACAAAAYVCVNLWLVGVPFPVSGMVKSGSEHRWGLGFELVYQHLSAFASLIGPPGMNRWAAAIRAAEAIGLMGFLVAFVVELRRRQFDRFLGILPFLVFTAGFWYVTSFIVGANGGWYHWPALLVGSLASFALLRFVLARVPGGAAVVVAVALLSTAAGWYAVARQRTLLDWGPLPGVAMDATVRFIREEIPPGDRIGGISSGIFTYFSGRDIENLEGLTNGAEFMKAHRDPATYRRYLEKSGIRWLVFHTTYAGERDQTLAYYRGVTDVDQVYDLDRYYGLGLRRLAPGLSAPDIFVLRLRN